MATVAGAKARACNPDDDEELLDVEEGVEERSDAPERRAAGRVGERRALRQGRRVGGEEVGVEGESEGVVESRGVLQRGGGRAEGGGGGRRRGGSEGRAWSQGATLPCVLRLGTLANATCAFPAALRARVPRCCATTTTIRKASARILASLLLEGRGRWQRRCSARARRRRGRWTRPRGRGRAED